MATKSEKPSTNSKTEEALRDKEQQFRAHIENCSDIVVFLNAEKKVTYVSPSITSLGYALEEIVGSRALDHVHPDDLNTLEIVLKELEQTPGKSLSGKARICCKDGSWQWFEGTVTNLLHVPTIGAIIVTISKSSSQQKLAPPPKWSKMSEHGHVMQFYDNDESLLDLLSKLVRIDLTAGDTCIVMVTSAHRESLEERLKANGLDLATAQTQGKYIFLDANAMLSQLMIDGLPEPDRFREIFGNIIMQAKKNQCSVRIFGEMVALLYTEGNQAAALRLEELWNDLLHTHRHFPHFLFCIHSMPSFAREAWGRQFLQICQQHSHIIPDESYTALVRLDERLHAIMLLQQKADSLQRELLECKSSEEKLKLTEKALQVSEERFRILASQSPIMIWQSDIHGATVHTNESWCRFTGLSQEESRGNGWVRAVHPEDRNTVLKLWTEAVRNRTPYHAKFRLRRSDGIYRQVRVYGDTSSDPEGTFTGYVGTILDITEQKALEAQREAFVSMITHELKTPLTALQGHVQLAQRNLTRLLSRKEQFLPEQQHMLEKVQDSLTRSQQPLQMEERMINDLLDSSRIQENKLELRLAFCDLAKLVSETVHNSQTTHPNRLITLELPEQDLPQVYADYDRLQQVLNNYLTNALKFSPTSEPIHVGLSLEAGNARVWVQDHGPGLSHKQQQHIWKRFYQVPQSSIQSGSQAGLGLGLYLCQQLINQQQGQVGVESTPERGATFWFTLPIHEPSTRDTHSDHR
jgi:PAS domain S-box-containing protein